MAAEAVTKEPTTAQAGTLTTASAVLEAYARAAGGPAIAALRTETVKGTLTRGPDGPAPFEAVFGAPGRWRYSQVFAWGDREAFGFDGTVGWVADTKTVGPMDAQQAFELGLLWDPQAASRLAKLLATAELKEATETTSRLVGRARDGAEIDLVFDRSTGLLVQAGRMGLEDYRAVDGVMRPFKVRLGDDMVLTVNEIRHGEPVDASLFPRPSCVLQAVDPPLYRPEKHVQVSTAAMDACVGEYETPDGRKLQVYRKENHLMYRSPRASFELLPSSETVYVRGYSNLELQFVKDTSGAVTSMVLVMPDRRVEARKVK